MISGVFRAQDKEWWFRCAALSWEWSHLRPNKTQMASSMFSINRLSIGVPKFDYPYEGMNIHVPVWR
jgi:hypothetical protein